MKRFLLILICIVTPICVWSQIDTLLSSGRIPMYAKVISNEKSFGSSFVVNSRFYMLDTITIDSVKYNLPSCFSVTSATNTTVRSDLQSSARCLLQQSRRQEYKDILSANHKSLHQSYIFIAQ